MKAILFTVLWVGWVGFTGMLVSVPQGVVWLLSGGCSFVWKIQDGLTHLSARLWGPLCSWFFIFHGLSSLMKSHLLGAFSLFTWFLQQDRDFVAKQNLQGGLKHRSGRKVASLRLLLSPSRSKCHPDSRGGAIDSTFGWEERHSHFKGA